MRFLGGIVVFLLVLGTSTASAQEPPPLEPPPEGPIGPDFGPPVYLGRLEFEYEMVSPKGELEERRIQDASAIRLGLGFNLARSVSMTFGSRLFFTEPDEYGNDFYYFDLLALRVGAYYDTGQRVLIFGSGEASLTGMSVPCDPEDTYSCEGPNDTEFMPRLGLHWRVGGLFEVTPRKFDIGVSLGGTKTIPDSGGWFALCGNLAFHWGADLTELKRKQALREQGGAPPPIF